MGWGGVGKREKKRERRERRRAARKERAEARSRQRQRLRPKKLKGQRQRRQRQRRCWASRRRRSSSAERRELGALGSGHAASSLTAQLYLSPSSSPWSRWARLARPGGENGLASWLFVPLLPRSRDALCRDGAELLRARERESRGCTNEFLIGGKKTKVNSEESCREFAALWVFFVCFFFLSFLVRSELSFFFSTLLLSLARALPPPTNRMGNLCSRIEVVADDLYSRVRLLFS